MIHSLELINYRGFERYKLSNLARVNLLVGKNNSGKSSILEAVQILAARPTSLVLYEIAERRAETSNVFEKPYGPRESYFDFSGFFHGREVRGGSKLSLRTKSDEGGATLDFEVVAAEANGAGESEYPGALSPPLGLRLKTHGDASGSQPTQSSVPLKAKVDVTSYGNALNFVASARPKHPDTSVQFVAQESLDGELMRELWDEIVLEGREQEVVDALQILEPKLSSIMFLSGGRPSSSRPSDGILLGFEGERRRRPLGSEGEGMRRLLALALCLTTAREGVLLIDEVDTGLHYSILGDVWLLIVETAKRYNIQVFLTTHSYDCVRALAWLCQTRPDLGPEVSIQKIERRLDRSVSLDAKQIQIAVEQDIEVR